MSALPFKPNSSSSSSSNSSSIANVDINQNNLLPSSNSANISDQPPQLAAPSDIATKTSDPVKRVSVTFKVAKGWRGTKSRDFPGRTFSKKDGDILQEWAREFRRGDALQQATTDERVVEAVVPVRLRKPYSGPTEIQRAHAFRWFRDTQDRLLSGGKTTENPNKIIDPLDICLLPIAEFRPACFEIDRKIKRTSVNEFIEIIWEKGFDARKLTIRTQNESVTLHHQQMTNQSQSLLGGAGIGGAKNNNAKMTTSSSHSGQSKQNMLKHKGLDTKESSQHSSSSSNSSQTSYKIITTNNSSILTLSSVQDKMTQTYRPPGSDQLGSGADGDSSLYRIWYVF